MNSLVSKKFNSTRSYIKNPLVLPGAVPFLLTRITLPLPHRDKTPSLNIVTPLGTVAILTAKNDNPCINSAPSVACLPITSFVRQSSSEDARDDYTSYMAGASGCAFLCAVFITLTFYFLVEIVLLVPDPKDTGTGASTDDKEMQDMSGNRVGDSIIKNEVDKIEGLIAHEAKQYSLRRLNPAAFLWSFVSALFLAAAVLCLLWSIAIDYRQNGILNKSVWPYIVTEVLVGIVLPILLFISATLFCVVLTFVTSGKLELRTAVSKFIPAIQFQKGQHKDYWVIQKFFYIKLNKRNEYKARGCCYACDTSPLTWCIAILVALQLLLAISYFVDVSIAEQVTVQSCRSIDYTMYECYNQTTFNYVDCNLTVQLNLTSNNLLHCFRFLKFGTDASIIASLSQAFAFALVAATFFSHAFDALKLISRIKESRWWSILFIIASLLLLAGSIWYLLRGDVVSSRIEIIGALQFIMMSLYLLCAGILMLGTKGWELEPSDRPASPSPH